MRDPERIDAVLEAVRVAWKKNPDLRLTQLLFNVAKYPGEHAPFFYNTEDGDLVLLLQGKA